MKVNSGKENSSSHDDGWVDLYSQILNLPKRAKASRSSTWKFSAWRSTHRSATKFHIFYLTYDFYCQTRYSVRASWTKLYISYLTFCESPPLLQVCETTDLRKLDKRAYNTIFTCRLSIPTIIAQFVAIFAISTFIGLSLLHLSLIWRRIQVRTYRRMKSNYSTWCPRVKFSIILPV